MAGAVTGSGWAQHLGLSGRSWAVMGGKRMKNESAVGGGSACNIFKHQGQNSKIHHDVPTRASTTGALRRGARLFFLTVSLKSRSIPGFSLASMQKVESTLTFFFFRAICLDERRALVQALGKTRIGESSDCFVNRFAGSSSIPSFQYPK